jgi:hypothetical protein
MTQPGGSVLGAPQKLSFMLRASPVVCAIDTLTYICGFCYYSCRFGVREAYRILVHLRFTTGQNDRGHENASSLRRGSSARLVGFVVLLVQTSRLFAFRGCPGTKCVASAYLASFLLVELLTIKADPPSHNDPEIDEFAVDMIFLATIWLSIAVLSRALDEAFGSGVASIVTCVAAPLLRIIWMTYHAIRDATRAHLMARLGEILVHTILLSHAAWGVYVMWKASFHPLHQDVVTVLALVPLYVLGVTYWHWYVWQIANRIRRHDSTMESARAERYLQQIVMWFFVIVHLVVAFVYYKFGYSTEGTYAPAWTSFFG